MKLTLWQKIEMVLSLLLITAVWACLEKTWYVLAAILLFSLFLMW